NAGTAAPGRHATRMPGPCRRLRPGHRHKSLKPKAFNCQAAGRPAAQPGARDSLYWPAAANREPRVPHASLLQRIESIPTRELYFFALYRVLEAGLVAALVFSPLSEMVGSPRSAALGGTVAVVYLLASLALL